MPLLTGWIGADHPVASSAFGRVRFPPATGPQHRSLTSELVARVASNASASSSAPSAQANFTLGATLSDSGNAHKDRRGRQQAVSRYVRLQSRRRNLSRSADWPVRPNAATGEGERSQSPPPPAARGLGLGAGKATPVPTRQGSRSDSKAQSVGSGASLSPEGQATLVSQAPTAQGPTCRWPGGPACPWPGGTKAITLDQLSKNSPQTMKALAESAKEKQPGGNNQPNIGTVWALLVLAFAYLHHSTTGFALPALLPSISPELELSDSQGALLTVGYAVLYAITLIPAGLLADRVDRPRLLAGGLVAWSGLTMVAAKVHSFGELLATRIGFAAAQSTQNPICFSLIPELFPRERTTAIAAYNSAIYIGRALSFATVIVASRLGMSKGGDVTPMMVPLSSLDLSHVSILYTQGEMAAITPIYDYDFRILHGEGESSWRQLLELLGPPGFIIAALALLTVAEPRKAKFGLFGDPMTSSRFINPTTRGFNRSTSDRFSSFEEDNETMSKAEAKPTGNKEEKKGNLIEGLKTLVTSRSFQATTAASALNDVGGWALVSWHATFYQRVFHLGPETYAPMLACIIPIGGIIGGVGGGLLGDKLSRSGGRFWLTAGATIAAAPILAASILAGDSDHSFIALLFGFTLSECWRAPAAILIRDVSPPGLGSAGAALHLCVRNLIGGMGPLGVSWLQGKVGLQYAMLFVPFFFFLSGCGFIVAEKILEAEKAEKAQQVSSQRQQTA